MSRLETRMLYGLRTDVIGNAHFITDDEVVYLVGNSIAVHNYSQRRQRLVRLPEKHKINLMTLSPNKKYLALCEAGEKPLISIYDLNAAKRKKLLGIPGDSAGVTSFSCVSFTYDSKYIAVVTSEKPTMYFYSWERGKVESSLDLETTQIPNSKINLMACNPAEIGIIALGGAYNFKFITLAETMWRPYGFSKADNLVVCSMTWTNSDRLLVGTRDGKILFLENGDLKNVFKMEDTGVMNLKAKNDNAITQSQEGRRTKQEEDVEIGALISFPRGFAFSYGYGKVILFEKENPNQYIYKQSFIVPQRVLRLENNLNYRINTISTNPSSDKLLVTTGWSQLYCTHLWGKQPIVDPNVEVPPTQFDLMGPSLHHGPIGGLARCAWKSQILTFGSLDQTVRMWDYEHDSLVMIKQYLEDITCVVMHPTGLFCLIGFTDKLRFMNILIDDFMMLKEFSIRNCKRAEFSYGGHMFAAVNGNIVQVYTVTDFQIKYLLKGHTEKIKALRWSQDDRKLITIGSEGAVYEWDMNTGMRANEVVLKSVSLMGIVMSSDGVTFYVISNDGRIHEIKDATVIRTYQVPDRKFDKIVKSQDDSQMYATFPGGFVASIGMPLTDPVEFIEYHVHYTDISKICLTYDEQILLTSGDDGTLCFWKVIFPDGKTSALTTEPLYLDQILISRMNLSERIQTVKDLNARIKELESEHSYKMRQTINQNNDKVRDLHLSYCEAIEELRSKIDQLEEDHTNEINNINVEITNTKRANDEAFRQMEISYDNKLIVEYDKYSAFEAHNNAMREDFERQLDELAQESQKQIEEVVAKNAAHFHEKDLQLKEAHEELCQQVRIHELIKEQIEDDADREIIELRTNYEEALNKERSLVLQYKGEAGVLRNKYAVSQKDLEHLKWQYNNLKSEYNQLNLKKEELEKNLEDLKNDLREKESMVLDRDKQITQLNQSNKELETFKFVLNHRIGELLAQIEPRDQEIVALKEKIIQMENELIALNKTNQSLELQLYELRTKLSAARSEIKSETTKHKHCQRLLRKIRIEILDTSVLINEPLQLKSSIIKLYNKYSDSEEFLRTRMQDLDAQCEFMKQRSFLENTIALLRKTWKKKEKDTGELDRLFEENITIMHEMSDLKGLLKGAQRHVVDMENLMIQNKGAEGDETAKITKACRCHEELENHFKNQLEECRKFVVTMKVDIDKILVTFPDRKSKTVS